MREFTVSLEGTGEGVLCNNPESMAVKKKGMPADQQMGLARYLNKAGELCFPATGVHAAMINVSRYFKEGRRPLTAYVSGSIHIGPYLIPFVNPTLVSDIRRVVVKHDAIMRVRAKILAPWQLDFQMTVDDDFTQPSSTLKEILSEAGRRVGIGDYRPEHKGWFGKFGVVKFEEQNPTVWSSESSGAQHQSV